MDKNQKKIVLVAEIVLTLPAQPIWSQNFVPFFWFETGIFEENFIMVRTSYGENFDSAAICWCNQIPGFWQIYNANYSRASVADKIWFCQVGLKILNKNTISI